MDSPHMRLIAIGLSECWSCCRVLNVFACSCCLFKSSRSNCEAALSTWKPAERLSHLPCLPLTLLVRKVWALYLIQNTNKSCLYSRRASQASGGVNLGSSSLCMDALTHLDGAMKSCIFCRKHLQLCPSPDWPVCI